VASGALASLIRQPSYGGVVVVLVLLLGAPPQLWAQSPESVVQRHWIFEDRLGSGVLITDSTGARLVRRVVDPFGKLLQEASSAQTPRVFGQLVYQPSVNLYSAGARSYDPDAGRFLSVDPIIRDAFNPQSLSVYAYAENNPVRFVDPTGLAAQLVGGPSGQFDLFSGIFGPSIDEGGFGFLDLILIVSFINTVNRILAEWQRIAEAVRTAAAITDPVIGLTSSPVSDEQLVAVILRNARELAAKVLETESIIAGIKRRRAAFEEVQELENNPFFRAVEAFDSAPTFDMSGAELMQREIDKVLEGLVESGFERIDRIDRVQLPIQEENLRIRRENFEQFRNTAREVFGVSIPPCCQLPGVSATRGGF
jgi:RHS repeat-associated protein